MTFFKIQERFNDETKIINYYVKVRYNGKPYCNHCQSTKVHQRKDRLKVFECNSCKNDFNIFKDKIFENSSTTYVSGFMLYIYS